MKIRLVLLVFLTTLVAACNSTAFRTAGSFVMQTAQLILQNHVFRAQGSFEGLFMANSMYAAIDAKTDVVLEYTAPNPDTGVVEVVWSKEVKRDFGRRAYRVVIGKDNKFIGVEEAPWDEALASLQAARAATVPIAESRS